MGARARTHTHARMRACRFNQLCLQNVANVWRKSAYRDVGMRFRALPDGQDGQDVEGQDVGTAADNEPLRHALKLFVEPIDMTLEAAVPQPQMFTETIKERIEQHKEWIITAVEKKTVQAVLGMVKGSLLENVAKSLEEEMVQQQQQEQEKQMEDEKEPLG